MTIEATGEHPGRLGQASASAATGTRIYIVVIHEGRPALRAEDAVPAAWEDPQYQALPDEQLMWLGRS